MDMTHKKYKNCANRTGFIYGEPTIGDLLSFKKQVKSFVNYYQEEAPSHTHPNSPDEHVVRAYHFYAGGDEPEQETWSSSLSCRHEILADMMSDYEEPGSITMVNEDNMLIAFFDQVIVVIE